MWAAYKSLGQEGLPLNHYDLAKITETDPELWKEFLSERDVEDWRNSEFAIIQDSELKKMTKDISKSSSVGQAQLMNTLSKQMESTGNKSGPAFIYCYIPLNKQQQAASNVQILEEDIFLKEC